MVKFTDGSSIYFDNTDFSIEKPERVELTAEEAELYSIIFEEKEIGAPIEVKEGLRDCLSEFVEIGLLEDERYPKVVKLAHEAMKKDYDAVERDRLHVINGEGDVEVICRYKTAGGWQTIAAIEKSLIRKFYKKKNKRKSWDIGTTTFSGTIKASGGGGGNVQQGSTGDYTISFK